MLVSGHAGILEPHDYRVVKLMLVPKLAINYRLKPDDLTYIFTHAEVDSILVDAEFVSLLDQYHSLNPTIPFIIDTDTGDNDGQYDQAVTEGLEHDAAAGGVGWSGLQVQAEDEDGLLALAYTSGTTARPKGVEYTHRSAYLAAMGNVIESGLNFHEGRCHYLWTLPMFHAMGKSAPFRPHITPYTSSSQTSSLLPLLHPLHAHREHLR